MLRPASGNLPESPEACGGRTNPSGLPGFPGTFHPSPWGRPWMEWLLCFFLLESSGWSLALRGPFRSFRSRSFRSALTRCWVDAKPGKPGCALGLTAAFGIFLACALPSQAESPLPEASAKILAEGENAVDPSEVSPRLSNLSVVPPEPNPFWTHAPLAVFGLGSALVGGTVVAIQRQSAGDDRVMEWGRGRQARLAVGFAGVSALASLWAYWHYASTPADGESSTFGAAWVPGGGLSLSARWNLP